MPDSEFWHRTEAKFRRLSPRPPRRGEVQQASHNGLCAWWKPSGWSGGKLYRLFNDGDDIEANRNIERLFKIVAERAEVELGHPGGEAAVFEWLDRLRLWGLYVEPFGEESSQIIHRVCDASAEYCLKCESEAKAMARAVDQVKEIGTRQQIAKIVVPTSRPTRAEVEQFANETFQKDIDDRMDAYARKQTQKLAAVTSTRNIGGYLLALIECKQERLRTEILILADARVGAGTIYAVPLGAWAEKALEKAASEMAAGTVSAFRGELELRAKRTRSPESNSGGNREIERAMKSAMREGKLRLKTQRIQTERSLRGVAAPLPPTPSAPPEIELPKVGRASTRKAFVEPRLNAKGWSILDWANESHVDFHTSYDYLKGITNPYRSTRKKLATSLGVPVESLPK